MKHSWHIWVAFGLCLAVLLTAMSWVSLTALRLERAETDARRLADREENVRLALWRMDSAVALVIARESARPYFTYTAFYPAERAYTRMFSEIGKGDVLIPSPLLRQVSPYILLHFQYEPGPEARLTSPQVPTSNMQDVAEAKGLTTKDAILAADARRTELAGLVSRAALLAALPAEEPRPARTVRLPAGNLPALTDEQMAELAKDPKLARLLEQQARSQPQANAPSQRSVQEYVARLSSISRIASKRKDDAAPDQAEPPASNVQEGTLRPLWIGPALVLARRIVVGDRVYVQGCWLDWPAIRGRLLEEAKGLLPQARLAPAPDPDQGTDVRMLAALPVRLIPGALTADPDGSLSPIYLSLIVAWGCVLLAAAAVAVLLRGAVVLSERRGAFVSAVTHEMRTPLTTFQMYTEMLDQDMVPDEAKRRRYLATLRIEADRLGHLVENVLAYARLERGGVKGRIETLTVGDLLDRSRERLAQRAEQEEMHLVAEGRDDRRALRVRADPAAVEQILFNLVDNACKYAVSAEERVIRVEAEATGSAVELRVRDHGPGVDPADVRRLFRPFCKSARDAARSAPGVGLGLALSRRLARHMGGDLRLDPTVEPGACFVLELPGQP